MGSVKTAAPSRDGVAAKGKTKGTQIKMAGNSADLKKGGKVKKMAGGGMTSSYRRAADGIASKGKTKGKMVKMAYGGKC